jgi:hypothetical protein
LSRDDEVNGSIRILQEQDNDQSLDIFMRNMAKFDRRFCEAMTTGVDFTLRLEIKGNVGRLNHCRVYDDTFDRPAGVEREQERK